MLPWGFGIEAIFHGKLGSGIRHVTPETRMNAIASRLFGCAHINLYVLAQGPARAMRAIVFGEIESAGVFKLLAPRRKNEPVALAHDGSQQFGASPLQIDTIIIPTR